MQFENESEALRMQNDLEYFQFLKNTITKTGFHWIAIQLRLYSYRCFENNQTMPGKW